ncbi:MAG TPA: glycosyltransferase family 9 protein [Mariniphaga anaerophila]|uniref:Glycosyltransferase family 9 protein n=1 Tax=Mariniphaga anaerophila TaxID=1484053 RepID=A0A831PM14_9BACT|nr:glycosyltransferase family 9 protein [Mariniphaga anaerophila]
MKYLVIRFSSIGDIVLTSPVVRCLKNQVIDAEVHFVTKSRFACLVNQNPYIDKVHLLTGNINDLIARLKEENFDYIIDLHHNLRSSRIKSRLKCPAFTFNKLNIEKYLLVNFKINRLPEIHIVDRYLETLSVFDVVNDGEGLDFFIPEQENFNLKELPEEFRKGYIAFVIAGTRATKKLPEQKAAEICNSIDFPVILLGGEQEQEAGESILRQSKGNVLNFAGKVGLNQSASLVRDASLVLSNDTGLMHIAAAFNKKILSFWGNTVPAFGMTPYNAHPASEMMEVAGLKCRPCSKLGYRKCPKKHFKCMEDQNVERAVQWINRNF